LTGPHLQLVLSGPGWASLKIEVGTEHHTIDHISYLSDALGDLVRIGIDIATDKGWSFAQFFHEPGSTILAAETGWWDDGQWVRGARLSAFAGKEFGGESPTWRTLHESARDFVVHMADRDELASLFLGCARDIFVRYGEDGYSAKWTGEKRFPRRAVAALEAALSTPASELIR
jgi:hypothetical protein